MPAGYRKYQALAPGPWFRSVDYPEYYRRYRRQLDDLDAQRVADELKALAAPHEPVLLCWEVPPLARGNWCHRSIVAQWLFETLGLVVPERDCGQHRSWNWSRLPPFTTARSPEPSKPGPASELRQQLETPP